MICMVLTVNIYNHLFDTIYVKVGLLLGEMKEEVEACHLLASPEAAASTFRKLREKWVLNRREEKAGLESSMLLLESFFFRKENPNSVQQMIIIEWVVCFMNTMEFRLVLRKVLLLGLQYLIVFYCMHNIK